MVLKNFIKDQKGQGLVEWAMLMSLVAVVAIAALITFGEMIIDTFYTVINDAMGGIG